MGGASMGTGYDVKPIIPNELKMGTNNFSTATDAHGTEGARASDRAADLAKGQLLVRSDSRQIDI